MSREMSRQQIASIKARYAPGTRIELKQDMLGENILAGTRGIVTEVDDIASVMMHWGNGSIWKVFFLTADWKSALVWLLKAATELNLADHPERAWTIVTEPIQNTHYPSKINGGKPSMAIKPKTLILSVSAGIGCYRHLKISNQATPEELSDEILDAFDFINDHSHALFMNNHPCSEEDCYCAEFVDEDNEYRHTCDYTLRKARLYIDQRFVYVFDFGDVREFRPGTKHSG